MNQHYEFVRTEFPHHSVSIEGTASCEEFSLCKGSLGKDSVIYITVPHEAFMWHGSTANSTRVDIKIAFQIETGVEFSFKKSQVYYLGWTNSPLLGDNNLSILAATQSEVHSAAHKAWSWIRYICNQKPSIQHKGGLISSYPEWSSKLMQERVDYWLN